MWITAALAVVAALFLIRTTAVRKVIVSESTRALLYRRGRFVRELAPGRHWVARPDTSVRHVDTRPVFVTVPGQDVLSADGVSLKVSLAASYEVADVYEALHGVDDYRHATYLLLQLALRELVGGLEVERLLAEREQMSSALVALAGPDAAEIGVRIRSAAVKDVMFPGDMKRVFSEVVQARQAGLAALERARGETAALRSLANAARLVETHPALLQLRLLQQLGDTASTVVLSLEPGSTGR